MSRVLLVERFELVTREDSLFEKLLQDCTEESTPPLPEDVLRESVSFNEDFFCFSRLHPFLANELLDSVFSLLVVVGNVPVPVMELPSSISATFPA